MQRGKGNLFIRADSTTAIGTGHIMRCIALAQAWQDQGGNVTFITHCEAETLRQRIQDEGFDFIPIKNAHPHPSDLKGVLSYLTAIPNPQSLPCETRSLFNRGAIRNWVVLDGYHFTPGYQKAIRDSGYKLLVIDDMAYLEHYYADILVNQNINAPELNYSCDKDTTQLLGSNYVMLRREFLEYKNWKREIPEKAKKILVTLGGADPNNVTLNVIKALKLFNDPDLEVKVIVGPSNPHIRSLETELHLSPFTFHLLPSVSNIPSLMAWADVAVSAAGSTCWELAFMGLPNMIVILAENQRAIASGLNAKGIAVNLGWYDDLSPDKIAKTFEKIVHEKKVRSIMSERGQKLADGFGGTRVVKLMMVGRLTLRPVQEQDCKLIWEWANDPDVRAISFSSGYISWNDHIRWFNSKLNDPYCLYYIAMNEREIPVGQVRFDKNEKETIISVSVGNNFRRRGCGRMIIELASKKFFRISDDQVVHAYIKKSNETSKHAFVQAGFRSAGTANTCGKPVIHLMLQRNSLA